MRTYKLLLEFFYPLLPVGNVPNRPVGFYGSLDSGCNLKKNRHGKGMVLILWAAGNRCKLKMPLPIFILGV
jgi:hypothetical protein